MTIRLAAVLAGLLAGSAHAAIPAAQHDADAFLATSIVVTTSPAAVDQRCAAALALAGTIRGGLEARKGPASIDADFRTYDSLENLVDSSHNEMDIIAAVNPAKPVRDAANVCLSKLTDASTATSLSRPIYDRLAAIPTAGLDAPTGYVLHKVLLKYRLDGVDKDIATRAKVQALKTQISDTGIAFDRDIAEDKGGIALKSADDLAGLPQDYVDAHKPAADGLIHISTDYPDVVPLLTFATHEPVRKQMYFAFQNRAWPANEAVLKTLLAQREALAHLLGFADYAAYATADKMIGTPQRAAAFLDEVDAAATPAAEADQAVLIARQAQFDPEKILLPWNSAYVTNLVTKEKYQVDESVVRQYFTFPKARAGIFQLVHDLFGADIRPWNTPVWDPSISAYELYDQGRLIGRFYLDMHPRDGKYNHAEQATLRNGLAGRQLPIGVLICNFPADGPMEHDDVTTFLHEFGHLLHTIYSGHQQFAKQGMQELQWDFIEAPSQLLEEWTWDYDTLKRFASNNKGEPIPQDLVAKMNAARHFGEAGQWKKQLAYSAISLNYYDHPAADIDLTAMWRTQYDRYSLTPYQEGVHPYAAFNHLNGYSAIYYTYVWSKAIALDLFTRFKAAGIRDPRTALGYRKAVLDPGGSTDANVLIQDFLGRPFTATALKTYLQAR